MPKSADPNCITDPDRIVQILQESLDPDGYPPTFDQFVADYNIVRNRIRACWGTWTNLLQSVGLSPRPKTYTHNGPFLESPQEILAALRSMADPVTGQAPARREFLARFPVTVAAIYAHFGTYTGLVYAAGLTKGMYNLPLIDRRLRSEENWNFAEDGRPLRHLPSPALPVARVATDPHYCWQTRTYRTSVRYILK